MKKEEHRYGVREFSLELRPIPQPRTALIVETLEGETFAFRVSGESLKQLCDHLAQQLEDPIFRYARGPEHDHDPPKRQQ